MRSSRTKKVGVPALDGEWSSIICGRYGNMYVERVAMVTKNTGSASLPLFCSLFRFFSRCYFTSFQRKVHFNLAVWVHWASQPSNKRHNKRFTAFLSEEKHRRLRQHVVLRQFDFFSPLQNRIIGGKKTRVSPEKIITPWQKRLSLCCSRTGQLHAWDTNVTFFSASYSKAMCLCVNCFALAFVTPVMMQNLIETSRDIRTVPDCLAGFELLMASTKPPLLKGSLCSLCPAHW